MNNYYFKNKCFLIDFQFKSIYKNHLQKHFLIDNS